MKNPRMIIQQEKLLQNVVQMVQKAQKHGVEIVGVTKGAGAHAEVVKTMIRGGLEILADSRLENLVRIKELGLAKELYLLRLPMLSQVEEVVRIADVSFNSQEETLQALSQAAEIQGKVHKVMLMVDVGDLREGVLSQDFLPLVEKALALPGIQLEGIATNVGCYGGVLPSLQQLELLLSLVSSVQEVFHYRIEKISGGNTATTILFQDRWPQGINQLRIGEGLLVGFDSTNNRALESFHQDAFLLQAEIIEVQNKPSYPIGEIGRDAFGRVPHFTDRGIRRRAVLALGRQDIDIDAMIPLLQGVEIIGGSSDHLLVDVTASLEDLKVGDILLFRLRYSALLHAMTSGYVDR